MERQKLWQVATQERSGLWMTSPFPTSTHLNTRSLVNSYTARLPRSNVATAPALQKSVSAKLQTNGSRWKTWLSAYQQYRRAFSNDLVEIRGMVSIMRGLKRRAHHVPRIDR